MTYSFRSLFPLQLTAAVVVALLSGTLCSSQVVIDSAWTARFDDLVCGIDVSGDWLVTTSNHDLHVFEVATGATLFHDSSTTNLYGSVVRVPETKQV